MLQPEPETGTAGDGAGAGAPAATNGAHHHHQEGGVETSLDIAAVGDEGGKSSGGNRWPRQETLALLQIRSDMDSVFRNSSHKGPLWEQVSRKMAELGYRRSDKKCREKFENVYKYHKRTKEGRAGKGEGKTYRFFDQLQAMESSNFSSSSFLPPIESAVPIAMAMPPIHPPPFTVPSTTLQLIHQEKTPVPENYNNSPSETLSSSYSTSSDDEITGTTRSRRKQKWKDLFDKLTKDVIAKQDELQRTFLEAIERRESERRVRDEAWKAQETARFQREYEILAHARSMASSKDTALVSFLQKLSDHHQIPLPPAILQPAITNPIPPIAISEPQQNNGLGSDRSGSARWPKEEIEELIKARKMMEEKFEEGGGKGAMWKEISEEMKRKGYNRNGKRCKEKWENINKYFRKVKESNKKPRVDSKTCPYYYQLDSLYSHKSVTTEPEGEDEAMAAMEG